MPETFWGTTRFAKLGSVMLTAPWVGVIVAAFVTWTSTSTGDSIALLAIGTAALAISLVVAWAFGSRPYVELNLSDRAVRLCQPVGKVQVLPLADIVDVQPSRSGLLIALRDGRIKAAWAVQTSIMDRRSHPSGTRSDRVASAIRAAMALEPSSEGLRH